MKQTESALVEEALALAYSDMVKAGLLQEAPDLGPREVGDVEASQRNTPEQENGDPDPAGKQTRPDELASLQHSRPRVRCTQSAAGGRNTEIRAPKARLQPLQHDRSFRRQIQTDMRDQLDKAQRVWSEASRAFRETRRQYSSGLREFLEICEEGGIEGTRTEFDARYFLNRGGANRRLAKAQSEYEHARKAAQTVGALPENLITSDFGDRSDDGYLHDDVADHIRRTDPGIIEKWRNDERQKDIGSEAGWEAEGFQHGSTDNPHTADSIAAESSYSQERYSTDRRKKLIDKWGTEQDEHRETEDGRRQKAMRADVDGAWRAFCGVGLDVALSAELLLMRGFD
ncbi:hypothetical protein LTR36_006524 [Oleoguttula mirabilis]|uniref:Uncharacterized protein n=1 Tax=Oleoguttula mirabilis TaxID=1507867 RepID=A0AAV9JUX9_9PEZI|nr:hypothetical protein LTR36_006524 [Oleoguttula mirabilis]